MENTISGAQALSNDYDVPTLTGADLMGRIYNVRNGRIARSSSVTSKQLFNFSEEMQPVNVGALGQFVVSEDLQVDVVFDDQKGDTTTEVFYSKDVNNSFSVNVGVSGSTGSFTGEMNECYSQTTENHYESSMALAKQFSQYAIYKLVMKGGASYWRSLLKPEVSADINGSMPADELVKTYGTHFLASGYFGGVWMYSQSISKYSSTDKLEVTNTLSMSAEYEGVKIGTSTENKSSTTTTETVSQTDLYLNTIGGTTTSSYDAWQESVNQGNWSLISFDNITDVSLQPLSVLVDPTNQQRIDDINLAIKNALAPFSFQALKWEKYGEPQTLNSGTFEKSFILNPETESNKVIIGLGFKVDDSNVTVLNAQLLDLETGAKDWYTTSNGQHVTVPTKNAEVETSCDNGFVVTGLALNAGDSKMYPFALYGQGFDVMNIDQNSFISNKVTQFGKCDDVECRYVPQEGNDLIITGIEIGVYHGDIGALRLHFGKFSKQIIQE